MIVTGVGTREPDTTSAELRAIMTLFCKWACQQGATLRSGGASGMDLWFERLWTGPKEIYIPWNGFEAEQGAAKRFDGVDGAIAPVEDTMWKRAREIAKRIHPKWNAMRRGGKSLHSRNVYQVLGNTLDTPSDIIVYYAKFDSDAISVKGGTRTAVHLAREYNIPEFNLILPGDVDRLLDLMDNYNGNCKNWQY